MQPVLVRAEGGGAMWDGSGVPCRGGLALLVLLAGCTSWKLAKPDTPDVRGERARRSEKAVREFEARRDRAEVEAALTAVQAGDLPTARARLEEVLARRPHHAEARRLLAELQLLAGEAEAAEQTLQPLLGAGASDAATSHAWGLILDAQGRTDAACQALRRAVELEPDNGIYQASYQAVAIWGKPAMSAKPATFAEPVGDNIANRHAAGQRGALREPSFASGAAAAQNGRDDGHGVANRRLCRLLPEAACAALEQAEHHLSAGRVEAAAAALRHAARQDPTNRQIAIAAAILAIRHNQPRLAVEQLESLPAAAADSVAVQQALGIAWYRLGDEARAEAAFRRAVALDNSVALSYFLLGCTLGRRGAADEADLALAQAARLDVHVAMAPLPDCTACHEHAARSLDRGLHPGSRPGRGTVLPAAAPAQAARPRPAGGP
ncbi:MAG: tetratricopeptide repeat protein [Pirellulales bacterium]|nr:tetratricopeptide repeat protein [Pirellulales bacterium]